MQAREELKIALDQQRIQSQRREEALFAQVRNTTFIACFRYSDVAPPDRRPSTRHSKSRATGGAKRGEFSSGNIRLAAGVRQMLFMQW